MIDISFVRITHQPRTCLLSYALDLILIMQSLKESVYKAMHPLICQFVGFQEAEIKPHDDGTATVTLNMKNGMHKTFKRVEAHWRRIDGDLFLSSSRVELKD